MKNILLKYKIGVKEIWLIGIVLLGFLLFILFTTDNIKKKRTALDNSHRYTVGTTIGKVKNLRSAGPDLNFMFIVNNHNYKGSRRFIDSGSVNCEGGRYYVRYQPEDPNNNELLLMFPVPDSIVNIPDSGWISIPIEKK